MWEPLIVHPIPALGSMIWYAQVEARKKSTKVTAARIIRKKVGGYTDSKGEWRKERDP